MTLQELIDKLHAIAADTPWDTPVTVELESADGYSSYHGDVLSAEESCDLHDESIVVVTLSGELTDKL